jgi:DNA-binding GntR family transcriptional regulator
MVPEVLVFGSGTSRLDASYEALRELIVCGEFEPGSRIIDSVIAKRLGVSRRTVQSALRRLQRDGLIQRPGGHRSPYIVTPLTIRGFRDLVDVILAVQCLAARRAAELEPAKRMRLVEELRAINEELLHVSSERPLNPKGVEELDWRFHDLLTHAVLGNRLREFYDAQQPVMDLYGRNYYTHLMDTTPNSVEEHDALIDAIQRGDSDAADRAARTNWMNGCERYAKAIEDAGERGTW